MTKVLVAGGAGLLGAAVARRLALSGTPTIAADGFDSSGDGRDVKEERASDLNRVAGVTILRTDLSNPEQVEALFAEHRPDVVVNAARFSPEGAGAAPLFEVAAAAHVALLVHLSDAALYAAASDPLRHAPEDEPLDAGDSPYLARRLEDERHLASLSVPHAVLRVFDLIGPSLPPSRFPMEALEAVLAGEDVFLSDDAPRDYLHLDDAARGVVLTVERKPVGRTLNIGSGISTAPSAFVTSLAGHAGRAASIRILTGGLPPRPPRIADMGSAYDVLGFSPTRTIDDVADEIVWTRLAPTGTFAREGPRLPPPRKEALPAPKEPPKPVSRRELFDLFRRPFTGD
ncbi:MAG TPA: NAD-dependent epimerase/dehydratase family protein [Thermoanaerobaculia bacterium]|nr:NAD-dependent epimerase/dehydratase family protein [Thermoanaerobaculia bacterium]